MSLQRAPEVLPVPIPAAPIELTFRAVLMGSLLGLLFAASSVYLGLKVGLTVSASIPIAVLSITMFRILARTLRLRDATILENNIVQTAGSAGESLAAGVAFTLPSLLLMAFPMELGRVLLVALLGGLIGTLMMIPLRQGLIVEEHGRLMYPEGTACAHVLQAGETTGKEGTSAKTVFLGFFVGLGYGALNLVARLWDEAASFAVTFGGALKGGSLAISVSPAMLGVGYIIGPRVASSMMAGGCLAFLVLVPLIHIFGDGRVDPMFPETVLPIAAMSAGQIRNAYLLTIGAGAVAAGGFLALARSIPTIGKAFAQGLKGFRAGPSATRLRTERDLPLSIVLGGSLACALAIWLSPMLHINLLSAALIVLFGFFFVTVSSRITGEMGSSANPISGMTVASLLIVCGLFVAIGWTGVSYKAMALTTAALVCVAASNGGTTSQDLKTGFLVGATPRSQQIAIFAGVVTSAIVIGFTLLLLNRGNTTFRPVSFPGTGAVVRSETMRGPEGRDHRVVDVREERGAPAAPRGTYLQDASGNLVFQVDPGVCGTYPYQLRPVSAPLTVAVPANAPIETGLDHKPYRLVTTPGGEVLADAEGRAVYDVTRKEKYDAPKAQLFRLIIDGTLGGRLPWGLVLCGVFLALIMELMGVAVLPFAVGLYLPIATSAGIFVGGLVRLAADRLGGRAGSEGGDAESSPGVLMASGLIAGGAMAGLLQAGVSVNESERVFELGRFLQLSRNTSWWPLVPLLLLALLLLKTGSSRRP
ncbi:MAG: oligopeptide transporter, OPT family [Thermoanaerobaculia bacterium]